MTLTELIAGIDACKPNAYTNEQKARWTGDLERELWTQVLLQEAAGAPGKTYAADAARPLLLGDGDRKLYEAYLTAQIDFANGEYTKYSNSMEMFNSLLRQWEAEWARRYRPADRPAAWVKLGSYTSADSGKKFLRTLPAGWAVLCVKCRVDEAFDTQTALTLGTADEPEALLAGTELDAGTAGVYARRSVWTAEGGETALYAAGTFAAAPGTGTAAFTALIQPGRTDP